MRSITRQRVIQQSRLGLYPSHIRDLGHAFVVDLQCSCGKRWVSLGRTEASARIEPRRCCGETLIAPEPVLSVCDIDMKTAILRWKKLDAEGLPVGDYQYAVWQLEHGIDPAEAIA